MYKNYAYSGAALDNAERIFNSLDNVLEQIHEKYKSILYVFMTTSYTLYAIGKSPFNNGFAVFEVGVRPIIKTSQRKYKGMPFEVDTKTYEIDMDCVRICEYDQSATLDDFMCWYADKSMYTLKDVIDTTQDALEKLTDSPTHGISILRRLHSCLDEVPLVGKSL